MVRIYKDDGNIIYVTNDPDIIEKLKKLSPKEFEEVRDFGLSSDAPMRKTDETSPFGIGTYHGLKPSDYINRYGVSGAIRMCTEKGIPEDMKNEIKHVCATVMLNDIKAISGKTITKEDFVSFVNRYEDFISVQKVLKKFGYGSIENYANEKSLEHLQGEFDTICTNLINRFTKALS